MIHLLNSGDKYSTSSHIETNSDNDNSSFHLLRTKLNIPINCFNNQEIRQHYLEEYSAKYSKAKHLLSNARKKQRKIIMTYYEEKEKHDNINELQTIKETLLEENEKIKKFKEALKDKLIIYHQRIQFLKDTEFCSTIKIEQLQNNTIQSIIENSSPTINDSHHLLYDHKQIKYSDHLFDDSCPTISNEYQFKRKSNQEDLSLIDDNIDSLLTDNHNFIETSLKHRKQSLTEIDENIENSISEKKKRKSYFQWLKDYWKFSFILTLNGQFDRFKILSTILIIGFAVFLVIFLNDLLEQFLIYLTKPSRPIATISPSNSMIKSLFTYWISTIYNYTTSWLLPFTRIFKFSV